MNLKPILQAILEAYALLIGGDHGVAHWARLAGTRIASILVESGSRRIPAAFAPTLPNGQK